MWVTFYPWILSFPPLSCTVLGTYEVSPFIIPDFITETINKHTGHISLGTDRPFRSYYCIEQSTATSSGYIVCCTGFHERWVVGGRSCVYKYLPQKGQVDSEKDGELGQNWGQRPLACSDNMYDTKSITSWCGI